MNGSNTKYKTIYIALALVVPIVLAYTAARFTTYVDTTSVYVSSITKEGVEKTIDNYFSSEDIEIEEKPKVHSFEVVDNNWVLVKVEGAGDYKAYMLLADFKKNIEPSVVLGMSQLFPRENISGIGVPYSIIKSINSGWGGDHEW